LDLDGVLNPLLGVFMGSSASNLCQPKFRILDDAQIGRIHDAVLRILDEVGVRINHPGKGP